MTWHLNVESGHKLVVSKMQAIWWNANSNDTNNLWTSKPINIIFRVPKKYWVLSVLIFHFSKLYRKSFKPSMHSHKDSGKARASIYKISINGFSLEIASLMRNDITKMHWKMSSPEYWYEKRKNKLFYSSLDVMIILSLSSDEWSKRKEKCQSFHLHSILLPSHSTLMNAWKYVNAP